MKRPIDAEKTIEEIRSIAEKALEQAILIPGATTKAIADAYVMGVNHAIDCINQAETLTKELTCGTCECWHRISRKIELGYCMAVHEDGFPFHPEQEPVTAEDFSCDYGRENKERG